MDRGLRVKSLRSKVKAAPDSPFGPIATGHPGNGGERVGEILGKWRDGRDGVEKFRKERICILEEYLAEMERGVEELVSEVKSSQSKVIKGKEFKRDIQNLQDLLTQEQNEIELLEENQHKNLLEIEESTNEMIDEMKLVTLPLKIGAFKMD